MQIELHAVIGKVRVRAGLRVGITEPDCPLVVLPVRWSTEVDSQTLDRAQFAGRDINGQGWDLSGLRTIANEQRIGYEHVQPAAAS